MSKVYPLFFNILSLKTTEPKDLLLSIQSSPFYQTISVGNNFGQNHSRSFFKLTTLEKGQGRGRMQWLKGCEKHRENKFEGKISLKAAATTSRILLHGELKMS